MLAIDPIKLFESGLATLCDVTWRVVCLPEQQLSRLMGRNRLGREEAQRWLAAQTGVETIHAAADIEIDNSGSIDETADQVRSLRELQCPHGQGYWFAEPLPPARAEQFLADGHCWLDLNAEVQPGSRQAEPTGGLLSP